MKTLKEVLGKKFINQNSIPSFIVKCGFHQCPNNESGSCPNPKELKTTIGSYCSIMKWTTLYDLIKCCNNENL